MVLFRGRGGRGSARPRGGPPPPYLMQALPPMRLKPGRGLARGPHDRPLPPPPPPPPPPAVFGPRLRLLRPRPGPSDGLLLRRHHQPRPLMAGLCAPHYPVHPAPGVPYRGRPGAGRGAKANTTPTPLRATSAKVVKKTSRTEKERDANDMLKPWVTPQLREEIKKKHEMHSLSRKSNDPKAFEAFKAQRNKVSSMLRAAKLEYIGLHEEQDVGKIMAEVGLIQAAKESASAAANETKSEPKVGNDTTAEQANNDASSKQADNDASSKQADNGAAVQLAGNDTARDQAAEATAAERVGNGV